MPLVLLATLSYAYLSRRTFATPAQPEAPSAG